VLCDLDILKFKHGYTFTYAIYKQIRGASCTYLSSLGTQKFGILIIWAFKAERGAE